MSEDTPLSVVIIGCGIIGINHARAIGRLSRLRIAALVDTVPTVATDLAELVVEELGASRPATFTSLEDALQAEPIDVAVICTPSGLHVGLAEQAVAAGLHVVIEKPLDVSMERARRIASLAAEAEQRGKVVSVISQHRFDPASVAVAAAAQSGELGRLTSAVASVAWWRSQEYYDSGAWRGTWQLDGGGAVMNQGVHTVDLLVWLLGRPVAVFAHTGLLAHERVEVEDVAVATVRFASGALAVLHATTAAFPGLSVRLQVHGSAGSAIIDDDQLEYLSVNADATNRAGERVSADQLRGAPKAADTFVVGHARQYRDIVEAIDGGRAPCVRVADALLSLAVVRSVYLSASTGREILVADVLEGVHDEFAVSTEEAYA
ncbi:Gfo/Idh/MocA family oxidoreductase [Rathayibacter sp. YIM 133350]|uniref:Gfo/Idh/MocA family protein n=1 Tax=Rathayibacter sp. YIM 133350 TaxID=3131992 RepID=UPI00307EBA6F